METKKWYQSKGVWTAIITALIGATQGVSQAIGHPIHVPDWAYSILGGMGLYSLRTADKPVA